jgi:hypothetical protein
VAIKSANEGGFSCVFFLTADRVRRILGEKNSRQSTYFRRKETSPFFLYVSFISNTSASVRRVVLRAVYKQRRRIFILCDNNNKAFICVKIFFSLSLSKTLALFIFCGSVLNSSSSSAGAARVVGVARVRRERAGVTSSSLSFCFYHHHHHHPRRRSRRRSRRLRKVSSSFSSLLFSFSPSLSNRPCSLFARA